MPFLPLLLAAAGAPAAIGLTPAAEVALPDRRIRLADVADLGGLEPSARAALAPRVIAAIPSGRREMVLSRQAVAGLVRRSVPGLKLRDEAAGTKLIFRVTQAAQPRLAGGCAELAQGAAAGEAVSNGMLAPVECRPGQAVARLRFDRIGGVVRASGALAAGAYLGRISAPGAAVVDKGDELTLVSRSGPVWVTRKVMAMQTGRAGGRLFVRDSEGHVTSAPLAEGAGR